MPEKVKPVKTPPHGENPQRRVPEHTIGAPEDLVDAASPYDLIAEFYDEDMAVNNPGLDVSFYVQHALQCGGPVLELGCGTGRITLPMVQSGCRVVGVDNAPAMIQKLNQKAARTLSAAEQERLQVYCMDMQMLELGSQFALILCPFSTFNYLVEDEAQRRTLERVRHHLVDGGVFILDTFVPHYDILLQPNDHVFQDYRRCRSDGTILERSKTIEKDLTRQVNLVTRTYRVLSSDGSIMRCVVTRERIRYRFRHEMELLLQTCGLSVLEILGGFAGSTYRYDSETMVFVAEKNIETVQAGYHS